LETKMIAEIKINDKIWFVKDPASGFWINKNAHIPQDAAMTTVEVVHYLRSCATAGSKLVQELVSRLQAVENFIKELEKDV